MKKTEDIANYLVEKYSDINDRVRNINNGGCGAFAERLYDILKRLGFSPKLIVLTDNVDGMIGRIKKEKGKWAFLTHVVVQLGDVYMDSEGVYKTPREIGDQHAYYDADIKVCTALTIKRLREMNKSGTWNRSFNRRQIQVITRKLDAVYAEALQAINKKDLAV